VQLETQHSFLIRHGLALLVALQLLVWTLVPLFTHTALPYDVIELTTLHNEWIVANYKHPNLPGWIYDIGIALTGSLKAVYLISQLCIVLSYLAIYSFSKEFLGHTKALVATALTSSILYYHWPTPEFNHNVLQIPLWAMASLAAWRAVTRASIFYWIVLGTTAGLLVWTKYSSGLLLLLITLWIVITPEGRGSLKTPGPWLALLISLLIAAPQFNYLISSDFLPLEYASSRAKSGGFSDSIRFIGAQLADHLFFLLISLIGGLLWRGAKVKKSTFNSDSNRSVKSFIWTVIVGPLAIVSVMPVIAGIGLKAMWGTPMFNFSGFLLLYWFGGRLNHQRTKSITSASLLLIPLIGALSVTEHLYKEDFANKPSRTLWPQDAISTQLTKEFEQSTGQPLSFVLGPYWEAGIVASSNYENVRVMVGGDPIKSPWISDSELKASGYLIVWQTNKAPEEPLQSRIKQLKEAGIEENTQLFDWNTQNKHPISLSYLLVPASE